jgi:hypothetical protein
MAVHARSQTTGLDRFERRLRVESAPSRGIGGPIFSEPRFTQNPSKSQRLSAVADGQALTIPSGCLGQLLYVTTRSPTPSTCPSSLSPALIGPTPAGVPEKIRSPACNVMSFDR